MKSFLGAYKVLSRVIPECSHIFSHLEDVVAGREFLMNIESIFSAKLRGRKATWLPCEIEALPIAVAT